MSGMNPNIRLQTLFMAIVAMLMVSCSSHAESELIGDLNKAITQKQEIDNNKEMRLNELRTMRRIVGLTSDQRYSINERLKGGYYNYCIDSAIYYCEENISIARELRDHDRMIGQMLDIAYLYILRGMKLEASNLLDSMRPMLEKSQLERYYHTRYLLYDYNTSTANNNKLHQYAIKAYQDSVHLVSNRTPESETSEEKLARLQAETQIAEPNTTGYAMAAYHLADHFRTLGMIDSAKYYFARSAVADIHTSNKNSGSMVSLARIYNEEGQFRRAYKYAHSAVEDATKGNILSRTMNMSGLYSIIVESYHENEKQTSMYIYIFLSIISLLFILVMFLLLYVYKQVHKLRIVERELNVANATMSDLNGRLVEQNSDLYRINTIRERYIAHFLDLISLFITKMDRYRHSLRKLAADHKMDELNKRLKSNAMIEGELQVLYDEFDSVFLELYPTFVEDFNSRLKPETRIVPKSGERMNTELRIFALMRLGFTNSSQIAAFLHCSLSTVYTYRTKIHNSAILPREEFEVEVMKIGKFDV